MLSLNILKSDEHSEKMLTTKITHPKSTLGEKQLFSSIELHLS